MSCVLIVEDEKRLRDIVRDYFTGHGLDCDLARNGAEALDLLRDHDYDAILLDILMPGLDGFAVCEAVRRSDDVPILFLTALGSERDVLPGAGAMVCGAITLDAAARVCTVSGEAVKLSPREFELLRCLMRNKGRALSREQLLDKVWGLDFDGGDRAVDARIRGLRAALGGAGGQIKTVFKSGYRLEEV